MSEVLYRLSQTEWEDCGGIGGAGYRCRVGRFRVDVWLDANQTWRWACDDAAWASMIRNANSLDDAKRAAVAFAAQKATEGLVPQEAAQ